ncbi:MAG: hypothetical protein P8K77_03900 [Polaribacter sp.]|nr:hypothetical protein [Polaribacter sp.]
MTPINNTSKEVQKNNIVGISFHSKRVDWNTKRRHSYKYITSVF